MRPSVALATRTLATLALATLALLTLSGCGEAKDDDPAPRAEVTAVDSAPVSDDEATVRVVDAAEADLVLYVSNQSFDDAEVRLTVSVDGVRVVDDDFHVEGQHNWVQFPLAMAAGSHEITAESDSGATLSESFDVPGDQARYAVIDHWTEGEPSLTWHFSRQPLAFA